MPKGKKFNFNYTLEREDRRTHEPVNIDGKLSCLFFEPTGNDCFGKISDIKFSNASGYFRLNKSEEEDAEEFLFDEITKHQEMEASLESFLDDYEPYDYTYDADCERDRIDGTSEFLVW